MSEMGNVDRASGIAAPAGPLDAVGRQRMRDEFLRLRSLPYRAGAGAGDAAVLPDAIDCWHLVRRLLRVAGVVAPDHPADVLACPGAFFRVVRPGRACAAGDVIWTALGTHVAVCMDGDYAAHAEMPREGDAGRPCGCYRRLAALRTLWPGATVCRPVQLCTGGEAMP